MHALAFSQYHHIILQAHLGGSVSSNGLVFSLSRLQSYLSSSQDKTSVKLKAANPELRAKPDRSFQNEPRKSSAPPKVFPPQYCFRVLVPRLFSLSKGKYSVPTSCRVGGAAIMQPGLCCSCLSSSKSHTPWLRPSNSEVNRHARWTSQVPSHDTARLTSMALEALGKNQGIFTDGSDDDQSGAKPQ
jgi:hypothetical protein